MSTLTTVLDRYQWWFFEQGGMHIWNELKRLGNAANTTQLGDGVAFNTLDYATNCNPDVTESVNRPQAVGREDAAAMGAYLQPTKPPTQYQG